MNKLQQPQGMAIVPEMYANEIQEAMQGINKLRNDKMQLMIDKHVPKWQQWVMKRGSIGKIFGYRFNIRPRVPVSGYMLTEEISLVKNSKELEKIIFTVKQDEGQKLFDMLPKVKPETPTYIG